MVDAGGREVCFEMMVKGWDAIAELLGVDPSTARRWFFGYGGAVDPCGIREAVRRSKLRYYVSDEKKLAQCKSLLYTGPQKEGGKMRDDLKLQLAELFLKCSEQELRALFLAISSATCGEVPSQGDFVLCGVSKTHATRLVELAKDLV